MADQCPEKKEIEQIFNRLRSISANRVCFDCNAKNPTWASVTYGVFICIDCSAVHRSLGVHLTFVRSTQLDTNWTWLQMRQMQLGGNANASQYFRQHNCNSNDAQQKYNSRVASMYRDKLRQLAQQAMNTYGMQTFIDCNNEPTPAEEKEPNFFESVSDDFNSNIQESLPSLQNEIKLQKGLTANEPTSQVDRKPTIGLRKVQPKRSGLGVKKGGLGATKVSTNFEEIEREANLVEQRREQAAENRKQEIILRKEDEEKAIINMRLAYKDLSLQQSKEEERLKAVDPKKAQQMERLGMGFAKSRTGVSHSALSDMKTIEQENLEKSSNFSMPKSSFEKDSDGFFDDFSFPTNNLYDRAGERHIQSLMDSRPTPKNDWTIIEPESNNRSVHTMFNPEVKHAPKPIKGAAPEDAAQKKFGSAKAISSDQYFNEGIPEYERNANLNRFQGSNSISSADYFGDGTNNKRGSSSSYTAQQLQNLDLDDVRQSVRQGVSKVAGKLSSLANGVMTTLQDKYGY